MKTTFNIQTKWCLVSLVAFASIAQGLAQNSVFTTWLNAESVSLRIEADWDSLWLMRDDTYVDARLFEGDESWKVELRLRGKSRRQNCDIPPFQLKFKKKHLVEAGLEEFNKIKVVTHCIVDDEEVAQENLMEEKLIYELYQLFTDESFRLLEAQLTYAYPDARKPEFTGTVLLLEPTDEISVRLGGEEIEGKYNVEQDSLNAANYNRIALFQFMIGNNDWDYAVLRNVKLIDRSSDIYLLVPYDFDYSAVVSPAYARLTKDYPIRDFRDRIYLGNIFLEELETSIQEFIAREDAVLAYVKGFTALKKSRCRQIQSYLRKFFKYLKDEDSTFEHGVILSFQ